MPSTAVATRHLFVGVCVVAMGARAGAAQQDTGEVRDTVPAAVFRETAPLAVTLETDLRALARDRKDEPTWQPAMLRFVSANGVSDSLDVEVRARGIFRRAKCALPPLRLNIPKNRAKRTPLEGLDKPKLVVHCQNWPEYEQYIVQEYLLYRVYNQLTPLSQRARLLRITYRDPAVPKDSSTHYAILLEEDEEVARRTGTQVLEATGAAPDDVDSYQSALVGVFQYLIGNTDWSIAALHNVVLLQSLSKPYPMAYDFDFSGAVNARYASPDPRLRIRSVRERIYRGYCTTEDRWQEVFAHVRAQREAITDLYRNEAALAPNVRDRTLRYFDDFFAILDDPARAERAIVKECRR